MKKKKRNVDCMIRNCVITQLYTQSTVFFMLSFVRELTCLAEKLVILFLMLEKGSLFSFEHSELGNKGF